jgi:hypothetical protein
MKITQILFEAKKEKKKEDKKEKPSKKKDQGKEMQALIKLVGGKFAARAKTAIERINKGQAISGDLARSISPIMKKLEKFINKGAVGVSRMDIAIRALTEQMDGKIIKQLGNKVTVGSNGVETTIDTDKVDLKPNPTNPQQLTVQKKDLRPDMKGNNLVGKQVTFQQQK